MSVLTTSSTTAPTSSYVTSIAHTQEQIHAAQRLRYQVFGERKWDDAQSLATVDKLLAEKPGAGR